MISTVIAVIYFIFCLLVFLAMTVAGIVWLILKPPAKLICGNVLIVAASLFVLVGLAGGPVMNYVRERNELKVPENVDPAGEAIVIRADAAANALEKAEAAELIKSELPYLKPFEQFLALPTQDQARESVSTFFKKLSPIDRHRVRIIERQNIFEHEIGAPFTIDSEEDSKRPHSKQFIELIRSVDKPLLDDQLAQRVTEIEKRLPEGFYRYSLLKATYANGKADQLMRLLVTDHQNSVRERMRKMLVGITFSYMFIFAGIVVLIVYAKSFKSAFVFQSAESPIHDIPFKRVYCFALLLYIAQFVLSFPVGLIAAVDRPIAVSLIHAAIPATTITLGLNLVLILLCAKWTIFNPLELKTSSTVRKLFSGNILKAAALGAAACCAVKAIVTIFYWLLYILFQQSPSTNNAIGDQISSVAMSHDPLNLVWVLMTAAVFAPLGEEFAFRGLLYPSIRSKAGVFAAIVFSSAIFAIYHMDPGAFMGLFAIGMGLAFLFERTKSLLPCVFMHAFWNSAVVLIAWLIT